MLRRPRSLPTVVAAFALALGLLGSIAAAPAQGSTPAPAHRILIAGDSIAHQASTYEAAMLAATGQVKAKLITVPGISFCALWPKVSRQLRILKPEVVVIEQVGTAYSPCAKRWGSPHSEAWFAALGLELERAVNAMATAGVGRVLLDGGPVSRSMDPWRLRIFRLYDDLAAAHPGLVAQITPGTAVEGPGRSWVRYLPCLAVETSAGLCNGMAAGGAGTIVVRSPDTFHLCAVPPADPYSPVCPVYSSGAFRYAAATVAPILSDWGLNPLPAYLS